VKTLNETNHLSTEERGYKEANIRDIPDALIARSSCSGSGTVVTRDIGSALEGEQATAKQLLVGWVLRLDPLCDGVLTIPAVEETGFVEAQHGKDGRCAELERSRSQGFQDEHHG
jgi:hypothetical protein